jgi:hypothetical protein
MLSKTGGADIDVNAKINKVKGVFAVISNMAVKSANQET